MIASSKSPIAMRNYGIIQSLKYEWPRGATNTRGRGTGRQVPMRVNSSRPLFHSPRKNITRRERALVWSFTNGQCWYCGFNMNPFDDFCIDHVVPRARGGTNHVENLVPACSWCNGRKGARLLEEWREGFNRWQEEDEPFTNALGLFAFERSREEYGHYSFSFEFSKSLEIMHYQHEGGDA